MASSYAQYFHLVTRVYVSKDSDFSELALVKGNDIDDLNDFIWFGYLKDVESQEQLSGFGGPISYATDVTYSGVSGTFSANLEWDPVGEYGTTYLDCISHTGIMFKYSEPGQSTIHLYCLKGMPSYNSYTNKTTAYFYNGAQDNITGKIVFDGDCIQGKGPFSPQDIRIKNNLSGGTEQNLWFLCFNGTNNPSEASRLTNGGNWGCDLYIINPNTTLLNKNYEIQTLDLPSVYKPFYMRSRIVFSNNNGSGNYKMFTNVYNGIGFYENNSYNIASFSCSINNEKITKKITGSTPTLLSSYDESVHSIYGTGTISDLNNINIVYGIKEAGLPKGYSYASFFRNNINYNKTVGFSTIRYLVSTTGDSHYHIILQDALYRDTTNSGVRYFIVSKALYDIIVGNTECNTQQIFELMPEQSKYNPPNGYKQFLSLYGAVCVLNYYDYKIKKDYGNDAQAILIRPDSPIYDFTLNEKIGEWHIIGITDPLIDLLVKDENLFMKEHEAGGVLSPHQNFVSIITYK